jgi:hypothetical protein
MILELLTINYVFSWYHQVPSPVVSRWFDLDDTAFEVWCTLPSTPNPGALLLPPAGLTRPSSAIYDFHKSVKRSVSDCNEDCLWHSWHRHLLTTARSHTNVDNVLNLSYSPATPDDAVLHQEQKCQCNLP